MNCSYCVAIVFAIVVVIVEEDLACDRTRSPAPDRILSETVPVTITLIPPQGQSERQRKRGRAKRGIRSPLYPLSTCSGPLKRRFDREKGTEREVETTHLSCFLGPRNKSLLYHNHPYPIPYHRNTAPIPPLKSKTNSHYQEHAHHLQQVLYNTLILITSITPSKVSKPPSPANRRRHPTPSLPSSTFE